MLNEFVEFEEIELGKNEIESDVTLGMVDTMEKTINVFC